MIWVLNACIIIWKYSWRRPPTYNAVLVQNINSLNTYDIVVNSFWKQCQPMLPKSTHMRLFKEQSFKQGRKIPNIEGNVWETNVPTSWLQSRSSSRHIVEPKSKTQDMATKLCYQPAAALLHMVIHCADPGLSQDDGKLFSVCCVDIQILHHTWNLQAT